MYAAPSRASGWPRALRNTVLSSGLPCVIRASALAVLGHTVQIRSLRPLPWTWTWRGRTSCSLPTRRPRLRRSGAGVVEEEQERVVTELPRIPSVRLPQEHLDFLGLEVRDDLGGSTPLRLEREDALALRGVLWLFPDHVPDERAERGEAHVSRRNRVAPILLQVMAEGGDVVDCQIVHAEIGDGAMSAIGDEPEEQAQRVAVGKDGVPTGRANPPQIVGEERLDEAQEGIRAAPHHAFSVRRRRAANRRLAMSSSSGVAVR